MQVLQEQNVMPYSIIRKKSCRKIRHMSNKNECWATFFQR